MMYYLLSLLAGGVIAVMVLLNGKLTAIHGVYLASVIIHAAGVVFAGVICCAKRANMKSRAPLWAYTGGAIGVLTTIFNNYAFGYITITSIVALGLLGQSLASVALDAFGWLGIKKRRSGKYSIIGYLAALIGTLIMINPSDSQALLAVILSLCAGVTVVLSRTVNSRLSMETSPIAGSLINHIVGLPICVVLALLFQPSASAAAAKSSPVIYLGGVLGVATVLLFNITVPKISAFRLTLLSFIGQIFMGMVLDFALGAELLTTTFTGGIIIAAGLVTNMILEQGDNYRKRKEEQYWNSIKMAEEAHWDKVLQRK